jgi:subtilisin-like proprotein convertase family protein
VSKHFDTLFSKFTFFIETFNRSSLKICLPRAECQGGDDMMQIQGQRFIQFVVGLLAAASLAACAKSPQNINTANTEETPENKLTIQMIYGNDDRQDLYQVNSELYRKLADSTVALVKSTDMKASGSTLFNLPMDSYGELQNLCKTEPFYDEPMAAFCSGSLVGPNLILTAGHCVANADECGETRFLFGYAVKQPGAFPATVSTQETYSCKRIVAREQNTIGADYALIELDRNVVGHEVLKLQRSREVSVGDALTVIGHPSGLPTKVASGGKVRSVLNSFFVGSLDTYGGNSGSAVFNSSTGEIVGVLVRGDTDFINHGDCRVSFRCDEGDCRGEDVTRIDQVAAKIPPVGNEHPNDPPKPPPSNKPDQSVFGSTTEVVIPDNNPAGAESEIRVPAVQGRKVLISVDISHTYVGDLVISLTAPGGKNYVLRKNKGGRSRDLVGTFGDTLTAEVDLSALANSFAGTWKLRVVDNSPKDKGTLRQWSVILK